MKKEKVEKGFHVPITFENQQQDINQLMNKVDRKKSKATKLYIRARAFFIQKLYKDAIKTFLESLMLDRNNVSVYIDLAVAYREIKNFSKAIETLEKAQEIDSQNPIIYMEKGITYSCMEEHDVALANIRQAITLDKSNPEIHLQLAMAHQECGENDLAFLIYDAVIEKNPSFIRAHHAKASLFMDLNMFQEAASIFQEILKLNPSFYRAILGIAVCMDQKKEYGLALRYYRKFMERRPHSSHIPDVRIRIEEIKKQLNSRLTTSPILC